MHMAPLIQDLAFILACGAIVAFVFHRLKQPVVVGYILAGALVGPHSPLPSAVTDLPSIQVWAEIGVIFVMFHLGLEFSFRRLMRLGPRVGAIGAIEIGTMMGLGWVFTQLVAPPASDALFVAALVAISSTTIIVKALNDLGLNMKKFTETVFGVLIVEDLVAVVLIVILSSQSLGNNLDGIKMFSLLGELVLVVGSWFIIGALFVPWFVRRVGQSQNDELLTLLALGLCLGLAVTATHFGFSTALGAFIMGSIIAETPESSRISRLIHPLRDVFAAVFFVSVGMLADFSQIGGQIVMILCLATLVIGGKFFALLTGSLLSGLPLHHSVKVGMSMGQVGEFSFIIAGIGVASNALGPQWHPIIIAVSILTSFATPYLIKASTPVARSFDQNLPIKARQLLALYSSWMTIQSSRTFIPLWLKPGLVRLILNAIVVAVIFNINRRIVQPWLDTSLDDPFMARSAGFCLALVLAGPFLFAMLTAARLRPQVTATARPPSWLSENQESLLRMFLYGCLTIVWVGILSAQYLSALASAGITLTLVVLLAILFYPRLEESYVWLERRFLAGLESTRPEVGTQRAIRALAPWDIHLVHLTIHPNSTMVGQNLQSTNLRQQYGLIVIAIRRGNKVMPLPASTEKMLPYDELLVLGTDEQVDQARPMAESAENLRISHSHDLDDYEMKVFPVGENSPLRGRTIQASRVREEFGCLIVGVERRGDRILSPRPDVQIENGDLLWIVGQRAQLNSLISV